MTLKIFSTKKFSFIFYPTFYLFSLTIAIIVGFLYSINFLYSYLLNSIFIFAEITLILSVERYLLTNFLKKGTLLKKDKILFMFFWKSKWFPAILLLICSIIFMNAKIIFINNFGLLYSAIILIIILVFSEILKLIQLRYLDLD